MIDPPGAVVPRRGAAYWIDFDPQAGKEILKRRPAIALSPEQYNRKTGLAVFCPITSKPKGYLFEVVIPPDPRVYGVILADQIKSLDWKKRNAEFIVQLPDIVVAETLNRVSALLLMGR